MSSPKYRQAVGRPLAPLRLAQPYRRKVERLAQRYRQDRP